MRKLQFFVLALLLLYGACWSMTIPEIHRRQTGGEISSMASEETRAVRGEGLSYGTLRSEAYAVAPFFYRGEVSTRFGEKDGYPTRYRYVGFGTLLFVLEDNPDAGLE